MVLSLNLFPELFFDGFLHCFESEFMIKMEEIICFYFDRFFSIFQVMVYIRELVPDSTCSFGSRSNSFVHFCLSLRLAVSYFVLLLFFRRGWEVSARSLTRSVREFEGTIEYGYFPLLLKLGTIHICFLSFP